ncbi:pre-rRNA-processing protein ESF2 [Senna tora]|uniref:Pre-rRNA-processing protein ESF2 n=1 Tax=Senna tora TaxID=362788 RepID=A0A834TE30_9FABA|nr:pre-rRNA-processing protein ESF2 [Senna tora]
MKKRKSKEASSSETLGEQHHQADGETLQHDASPIYNDAQEVAASSDIKKKKKKKKKVWEENPGIAEEEKEIDTAKEPNSHSNDERKNARKIKLKKRLLKEAEKADKRGVCYLSRIPPHMDHVKLRHILSQYGDIQRIYLAPEGDSAAQAPSKGSRGSRDRAFSEGWVEFTNKTVAKRVANMLNGEQIGGKKRSSFYYDLWNIKYLSKFKWDDLTEELAYKKAIREQKLALELSAAKRERDFYLSRVDQSRALSSIEERLKKKQKVQEDSGPVAKVIRHFPQKKPIPANAEGNKAVLSDDILDAVFGGS